jgi:hypothetical protein
LAYFCWKGICLTVWWPVHNNWKSCLEHG